MSKLRSVSSDPMPCPRFEFRWQKNGDDWTNRIVTYSYVFPLEKLDIRRENYEGDQVRSEWTVEIGKTTVTGGRGEPPIGDTWIDTPFRDGAHAVWDAKWFGNPPVVAVCDDTWCLIEKESRNE